MRRSGPSNDRRHTIGVLAPGEVLLGKTVKVAAPKWNRGR